MQVVQFAWLVFQLAAMLKHLGYGGAGQDVVGMVANTRSSERDDDVGLVFVDHLAQTFG